MSDDVYALLVMFFVVRFMFSLTFLQHVAACTWVVFSAVCIYRPPIRDVLLYTCLTLTLRLAMANKPLKPPFPHSVLPPIKQELLTV